MSNQTQPFPTWLIVLMFFLFWPVAVVMLVQNSEHENKMRRMQIQNQQMPPHGASGFSGRPMQGNFNANPHAMPQNPMPNSANFNAQQQPINPQAQQQPRPTVVAEPGVKAGAVVGSADVVICEGCGHKAQVVVGYGTACAYCGSAMISRADPEAMARVTQQQIELENAKNPKNKRKKGALSELGEELDGLFEEIF